MAMHRAAVAERAASRAWQAGMAIPQAGPLVAAMVKTQARPRRGGGSLRWRHITIGSQFCSSFFAKLYGSKQRSLCILSLFFRYSFALLHLASGSCVGKTDAGTSACSSYS
jgi:hypothetical protein